MSYLNFFSNYLGKKVEHIWKRDKEGYYTGEFTSIKAKKCFDNEHTIVTLKTEGECAALILIDHPEKINKKQWAFCQRLQNYNGHKTVIPIPKSTLNSSRFHEDTGYEYVMVSPKLVHQTGEKKSFVGRDTYKAIRAGVRFGLIPKPNSDNCPEFISVEWIGSKHGINADNVPCEHGIVIHGTTKVIIQRNFKDMLNLSQKCSIEGIVIHALDGDKFKIDMKCFQDSRYEQAKKLTINSYTTSIKPVVIVKEGVITLGRE